MNPDEFPFADDQPARWRAWCELTDAWEAYYLARHMAYFRAKRLAIDKAMSGKRPPSN